MLETYGWSETLRQQFEPYATEGLKPGRIIIQRFSWRWYFETARKCKLYDFTRRCWTDFQGRPTSDFKPAVA